MSAILALRSSASESCAEVQFPQAESGPWHVLHTRSRQEKAIAQTLSAMGVAYFLPLVRQARYYGRRKLSVDLPLFPSYVFLRGGLEDAYEADRTGRIASIIPVVDQDRLDMELRNIYVALVGGADLEPYPHLTQGTRVEVRAGPFRGLQGVVDRRLKNSRLILQVDMLGRAVSMEMDAALLDPID